MIRQTLQPNFDFDLWHGLHFYNLETSGSLFRDIKLVHLFQFCWLYYARKLEEILIQFPLNKFSMNFFSWMDWILWIELYITQKQLTTMSIIFCSMWNVLLWPIYFSFSIFLYISIHVFSLLFWISLSPVLPASLLFIQKWLCMKYENRTVPCFPTLTPKSIVM